MLALSFTFPAGRYHATPWDQHVNEGAVAWPPDPWRILRALIATWHHKIRCSGAHREPTMLGLIESLAQELPKYRLPAASHSHTRHYMPQFAFGKTSLVFDAFTAVKREDPLAVVWPHVELPDDQLELLDELLSVMGYLGRAESWVEARRLTEAPTVNCIPGTAPLDAETGELKGDIVTFYAPLPHAEYRALRQKFLADKKSVKKLARTLPEHVLDALSVDTAQLRKQGWNQPPAARKVRYLRPVNALRPVRTVQKGVPPSATTVQFILIGKPLPRVENSLRIGELMRKALMSKAKQLLGNDNIPPPISGHGLPANNRHGHAFYLPWDSNGDGFLDRVVLHVPLGMDAVQLHVVEGLRHLKSRRGMEWRLVLESTGNLGACPLFGSSTVWESVTPYLHPWHRKTRFGIAEQLRRECRERGIPQPISTEPLDHVRVGSRKRRPIHFQRFRRKRDLRQPDTNGSLWKLTFPEPVEGPIALGFGCHFGLGIFAIET